MRNRLIVLTIALCFLRLEANARQLTTANIDTVEGLYISCKQAEKLDDYGYSSDMSPVDMLKAGYCNGFFKGIVLALQTECALYRAGRSPNSVFKAGTQAAGMNVLRKVFLKWADNNPKLYEEDIITAMMVTATEFPCD